jgi:hypothetical protein
MAARTGANPERVYRAVWRQPADRQHGNRRKTELSEHPPVQKPHTSIHGYLSLTRIGPTEQRGSVSSVPNPGSAPITFRLLCRACFHLEAVWIGSTIVGPSRHAARLRIARQHQFCPSKDPMIRLMVSREQRQQHKDAHQVCSRSIRKPYAIGWSPTGTGGGGLWRVRRATCGLLGESAGRSRGLLTLPPWH